MNVKPNQKGVSAFFPCGSEKFPGTYFSNRRMPGLRTSEILAHSAGMLAVALKITHLGTDRLKNHGYNPITVFSARIGLFSGFILRFMQMHKIPSIPYLNTRNLPVVFCGGGFAGRAGFLFSRLRFSGFF
jgi:hypothetical protein